MDISSNKQAKSHTRKLGHGQESETLREKLNQNSSSKQRYKNYVKVKINKTQQNSRYRFCNDRDETINHIIRECSKVVQRKYKNRHGWLGKGIHRELCKKFEFTDTNKWYMHNPESAMENVF